jgi:hypothetical protein
MTLAVLTMTAAQLFDLGTFIRLIDVHGIHAEANPLVHHLLAADGLPLAGVAKVAGLAVVVAVTVVLAGRPDRPSHPRLAWTVAAVAVLAGLVGGLSNALVILGNHV